SLHWLLWSGSISLSVWSVLTNALFVFREQHSRWAARLHLPPHRELGATVRWFVPASVSITLATIVLSYAVIFAFNMAALRHTEAAVLWLRLAAAFAILALAMALAMPGQALRHAPLQRGTLFVGALAAIAIGWALIEPGGAS